MSDELALTRVQRLERPELRARVTSPYEVSVLKSEPPPSLLTRRKSRSLITKNRERSLASKLVPADGSPSSLR
jgi:hypothetical protein